MIKDIKTFFAASNSVRNVAEGDYQKMDLVVNAARAFSRSMYQCVYVIDYFKQSILYVSESLKDLCGKSPGEIEDIGYNFYMDYVPEKEQQMLQEINRKGFALFYEISVEERQDYVFSYNFHIINGKRLKLVNHRLTPMALTKDGFIWLALCVMSISTSNALGNIIMKKAGLKFYYEYSLHEHRWLLKESLFLNETEHDILIFSAQGYTMDEIAGMLCKSVNTIKACKRNLFSKLRVNSIAEALSCAMCYKLL